MDRVARQRYRWVPQKFLSNRILLIAGLFSAGFSVVNFTIYSILDDEARRGNDTSEKVSIGRCNSLGLLGWHIIYFLKIDPPNTINSTNLIDPFLKVPSDLDIL
ncbi:hypothetical protein RF11_11680 [Thelohanellus kitauei]|uniref:Uncharacterized protein n=1 Tax=Thelohanellus kitauei TaxID=669202 RepID=A0A0C2IZV4_THEKT|nr:hypothetical protein RF11_11680 [Thelohanellus kitauei]